MIKKVEIGLRLKEFATKKLLSLAELSRLLGMNNPQGLNPYTSGKSILGGELLSKLAELGCDINWLLNGSPTASMVKEPEETATDYKIKALEGRITKLESKLFQVTEENETLKEENKLLKHSLDQNIDSSKSERNNIH